MKSLRVLLLLALMVVFAAPAAQAQNYVRKIDSFDFLVDNSGSMMMTSNTLKTVKMKAVKQVLLNVNSRIPDLGYNGSLHTFAPVNALVPQGAWNVTSMEKGINALRDNLEIFGRMTPMGNGLMQLAPEYQAMARPAGVIIASDGESNRGIDPIAEIRALYNAQPDICFHVISFADTKEGQATLDQIAALNPCSVSVTAANLLASEEAVNKFVADVFLAPGGAAMEDVIVLRGVNFAFDSYVLDDSALGILNEVAAILKETNRPILLQGWTDSRGTDAYNKTLSLNRANAVKNYLVKLGIPSNSIISVGMGKSFKYSNDTEEGRYMNRRTEISFE